MAEKKKGNKAGSYLESGKAKKKRYDQMIDDGYNQMNKKKKK